MPRYMVLFKANPSVWPPDPKQALAVLEGALAGGDQLLRMGAAKEIGWFTPQEGYAIFEAEAKEKLLGMVQPYFPHYSQDIHEIVPWGRGKQVILDSARRAASR